MMHIKKNRFCQPQLWIKFYETKPLLAATYGRFSFSCQVQFFTTRAVQIAVQYKSMNSLSQFELSLSSLYCLLSPPFLHYIMKESGDVTTIVIILQKTIIFFLHYDLHSNTIDSFLLLSIFRHFSTTIYTLPSMFYFDPFKIIFPSHPLLLLQCFINSHNIFCMTFLSNLSRRHTAMRCTQTLSHCSICDTL